MNRIFWIIPVATMLFSACVSNKKIVYLQKDDLYNSQISSDTTIREYKLQAFDYRIQTNDILSIRFESLTPEAVDFFRSEQQGVANLAQGNGALILGELVDENGEIPIPVVGKFMIAGLTVFEAQKKLTEVASNYIQSPIVKVRLINYRVTVLGEVNREGLVNLQNNRVTFLEAIGSLGGFTDLADRSAVKLIRQNGDKVEVHYLNFLSEDFIDSPFYYIHQNDILVVPPLKQRPFRKYFGPNASLVVSTLSILLLTANLIFAK